MSSTLSHYLPIADRIRKHAAVAVEAGRRDGPSDVWIPLEPVLGILVPEVVRAVTTRGAEGAVFGVEGDGVDAVDVGDAGLIGRRLPVSLEREFEAV